MARPDVVVNLAAKLTQVDGHWSPKVVLEVNGLELKVVKVKGRFVWHDHPEGDELFIVLKGRLSIELRDRATVWLNAGETFVVPCGLEHRPAADDECEIMILDAAGVVNTGATGSALTSVDEWI